MHHDWGWHDYAFRPRAELHVGCSAGDCDFVVYDVYLYVVCTEGDLIYMSYMSRGSFLVDSSGSLLVYGVFRWDLYIYDMTYI